MKEWESIFDKSVLSDGARYFRMGKAKKLKRTDAGYEAVVRDDRNYRVGIELSGDAITGFTCTCGQADKDHECAHIAAAMYLLDAEVGVNEALMQNEEEEMRENGSYPFYDEDDWDDMDDGPDDLYDEPLNREDRRFLEKERRRDRKERNGQRREGQDRRIQEKQLPVAEPKFGDIFPELAKIQDEERREIKEDLRNEGGRREEEPYRYFQYEHFRKGLNITESNLREAERLLRQKAIHVENFNMGYNTNSGDGRMLGETDAFWYGRNNLRYRVEITFSQNRVLRVYCGAPTCDCYYSALSPRLRLCPHIIATLILTEEHLKNENPGTATNYAGSRLLSELRLGGMAEKLPSEPGAETEELTLEPTVRLDEDNRLSVSFRTGKGKLYKIRSLREFSDNVRNRRKMEFGKNTELLMAPEYFRGGSAEWLRFIDDFLDEDDERRERRNFSGRFGNYYDTEKQISDSIPLYGLRLDRFFEQIMGKETEFAVPGEKRSVKKYMTPRDSEVSLQLGLHACVDPKTGIFQGIQLEGAAPELIDGTEASYYINETEVCRVKKEDLKKQAPLLGAAQDGRIDIQVGRRNLGEFYHKVLPVIREAAHVTEHDAELIAAYVPPEPMFICYLDVENDSVVCRTDVWYGNRMHLVSDLLPDNAGRQKPLEDYRDRDAEGQVLRVLLAYMEQYDEEWDLFFTPREDLPLFNFLQEGLGRLMELCEVRTTEAFRRLRVRRRVPFEMKISMGPDLLDLALTSGELGRNELMEIFRSYRQKKVFIRLRNGDFFQIDQNETLEKLSEMMDTLHIPVQDFVAGKMHLPAYRALYLEKMLEETQDVYADRDRHFKEMAAAFRTPGDTDYLLPESLRPVLRGYQRDGYRWLRTLDAYGFGGILADEMGLGKTLQAIAVLLAAKEERKVVPTGRIVDNAKVVSAGRGADRTKVVTADRGADRAEVVTADRGADRAKVASLGRGADRAEVVPAVEDPVTSLVVCPASLVYNWEEELHRFAPSLSVGIAAGTKAEREERIGKCGTWDVLITSYDLLKRDIALYEGCHFRYTILDEAQYIKNRGTAAAKSVKLIHSRSRFALTGTPIENRLAELWSIFDFLMPGLLYEYPQFQKEFELPVAKNGDKKIMERLRSMTSPFILRRMKQDVLKDLPEKLEEVRYAVMEEKQRRLYDAQVLRIRNKVQVQDESEFRKSRIQILAELTKIRQICCDPSLLFENYDGESAKRQACMDLIGSAVEGEHKILVFSQFTSMLELLEEELRGAGITWYKITGATPKEQRIKLVKQFNEDDTPVFLISLKAGGTGLNLTGADIVIHYDPWWNLAVQNQATDRAHRIGQQKIVTVYKLITKGTIEEKILDLQENKKQLAEDILSGEAVSSASLSREDLMAILEER